MGWLLFPVTPRHSLQQQIMTYVLRRDLNEWTPLSVGDGFPWPYCRAAMYVPMNGTGRVYIGAGNGPPGDEGGLFYTDNLGESWERADLGLDSQQHNLVFGTSARGARLVIRL